MIRSHVLAVAVGSVLVLACGSAAPDPGTMGHGPGAPDGGDPGPASLTVSPPSLRVLAGSDAIALHATLVGGSGPISWSLSGPGSLGAASGSETTYTPPARIDAETVVTVTATAGSALSALVHITVDSISTLVVQGQVVGPTGAALSGLTVAIGTKTTVTAADGHFSISDVVPPYNVNIVLADSRIYVGRYEGLIRPDPTLVFLWLFSTGEPNTATIAGTVSGGNPIPRAGEFTTAFFTTPDVRFDFTAIGLRTAPFTLPVSWFGPGSITGTVHVLQFTSPQAGSPPTAYTGYGTHPALTIGRDDELIGADVALTVPGNASIGGAVVPPDGYTVVEKTLGLEIAGLTTVPMGHVDTADTDFTFTVPEGIPATARVTASAQRTGVGSTSARVSGVSPRTSGISIALPAPALPTSPADGAHAVIARTPFTWTPVEHAVHFLVLDGGPDFLSLFVVTAGGSTLVPNLPGGGSYQWFVAAFGPFETVDAFTGGANVFPVLGDSFQTVSVPRTVVSD